MRVVIIGGGISGLSAAYYLKKAGVPSTIVETRPYLGGVIRTEQVEGCLIETGPDSYLSVKPWATDLIRDLGLDGELIGSNDHLRKTFIRKSGRMIPLPDGLQMMVPTRIAPMVTTGLLSWGTKLRMGLEWFRRPPSAPLADRSVADFVRDHYGQEAVDYLAEPLLAGVYGGDPEKLSVSSVLTRFTQLEAEHGSLTRGVVKERGKGSGLPLFRTLKGGLSQLTEALARGVAVARGEAETLDKGWRVRVSGRWLEADEVVLACEAHRAASLLAPLDGRLAELLGTVGYSSSTVVALGFDRRAVTQKLEGFGFLVPKRERRNVVACTYVGTKFAHRTPDDTLLLRCFLGGADEVRIETVIEELRDLAGITAAPRFSRVYRWPRSMAQYPVGHQARMAEVETRLKALPGLHLAGNGYYGIGIPDCVRMGKQAAERIRAG